MKSRTGQMVPIRSLAEVQFAAGPDSVERFNALPAIKILGEAKPGYSSGQAIAAMERVSKQILPADMGYDWGGESFQQKRTSSAAGIALGAGILMIFLILAAQYERWSLPFLGAARAVLRHLRRACCRLGASCLRRRVCQRRLLPDRSGDTAWPISENAILIVEFAMMKVQEGLTPVAAALEAARLRFRQS